MNLKEVLADLNKKLQRFDLNEMLKTENLVKNIPFFLYLVLLAMIYISNTHSVESTIRRIDSMKNELKEVRWNYMAAKSDLMFRSKQTEVANSVERLGLKELTDPPKKIIVTDEH